MKKGREADAPRPARLTRVSLELEPQSELDSARVPYAADPHEVRIHEPGDRVAPPGVVQHVLRLGAELHAVVTDRESAEQAEIEVPLAGPTELVASRITPLGAGLSKRGGIVVNLVRSGIPDTAE